MKYVKTECISWSLPCYFYYPSQGNGEAMLIRLAQAAWKERKSRGDGPCMFAWKGRPSRSQISSSDTCPLIFMHKNNQLSLSDSKFLTKKLPFGYEVPPTNDDLHGMLVSVWTNFWLGIRPYVQWDAHCHIFRLIDWRLKNEYTTNYTSMFVGLSVKAMGKEGRMDDHLGSIIQFTRILKTKFHSMVASVEKMEEQDKKWGIVLSNLFMRQSLTITWSPSLVSLLKTERNHIQIKRTRSGFTR